MPTYEYACQKCAHRFEKLQSINDKPVARCPKCRGKVRRVIHGGAGLVFKGSGFYCTDYRSGSSKSSSSKNDSDKCGCTAKPSKDKAASNSSAGDD